MASSVARIRAVCPRPDLTCLIRTLPVVSVPGSVFFGPRERCQTNVLGIGRHLHLGARTVGQRTRFDAPLLRNLFHGRQAREPVHGREHHVVRVRRAERLREDVRDADALHHGARAARPPPPPPPPPPAPSSAPPPPPP